MWLYPVFKKLHMIEIWHLNEHVTKNERQFIFYILIILLDFIKYTIAYFDTWIKKKNLHFINRFADGSRLIDDVFKRSNLGDFYDMGIGSGGTIPIPIFIPNPDPDPEGTKSRTGSGSGRVITVKQRDPVPIPIPVPIRYFVRIRILTHIIRRRRCRYQNPEKIFQRDRDRDGFLSTRRRSGSGGEKLDPAGPYMGTIHSLFFLNITHPGE
jgi:hypothetical protein